ncbi:uncharacterized protein LOC131696228 [Topomyia yanbarensis]|uniref:uncharacterized protein LOC131696228 n=2 Tax=Topomyia yanbarensis TaxID=2498891 RepID=UPI00273CF08B|nr:uncharacterized protein LOC131696228 [Topomyia yanbarensis]
MSRSMTKKSKHNKLLYVRRTNILGSAKLIQDFDENYTAAQANEIPFRLQKLDALWEEFEEVENEIDSLRVGEPVFSEGRSEFQSLFFQLKGSLSSKIPPAPPSPLASPAHMPPPQAIGVRLPEIKIPEFNGNIEDWSNFHDVFDSMIHKNLTLPNIQKLHYLRASLKGDAARIIQSIQTSGNNYPIAWKLITDRFDNTNLLVKQHVSALFNIPPVRKESASGLSDLVDNFERHIQILDTLEDEKDHWNSVIVELLSSRLDPSSQREWESECSEAERPNYKDLVDFVHKRARMLQSLKLSHQNTNTAVDVKQTKVRTFSHVTTSEHVAKCVACNHAHLLFQCDVFRGFSPQQRFDVVKRHGICINCLKGQHFAKNCTGGVCKHCNQKHHTLLHLGPAPSHPSTSGSGHRQIPTGTHKTGSSSHESGQVRSALSQSSPVSLQSFSLNSSSYSPPSVFAPSQTSVSENFVSSPPPTCQTIVPSVPASESTVFLPTALIKVQDVHGSFHFARALLDSGSQPNCISESLCQKLCLKRTKINQPVSGVGQSIVNVRSSAVVNIVSRFGTFSSQLDCLVLPKLTHVLPARTVDIAHWKLSKHLPIADPQFHVTAGVDMLIGAELFIKLLQPEQIHLGNGCPTLQKTALGYVVAGKSSSRQMTPVVCNVASVDDQLDAHLQRFWEIEGFEHGKALTKEEQLCEDHFQSTHSRASDGRYIVRYATRQEKLPLLGDTMSTAQRRFNSLERRFRADHVLHSNYSHFMNDYEQLGHMEEVEFRAAKPQFILPHHAVHHPDSTTTKIRVVFDGSSKSSNHISLNDLLHTGPTVQPTLLSIVLNFRLHRYVASADIKKMFRQILIHPDDRSLQQILWRKSESEPLKLYQLRTVTYGTSAAPFQATRVLNQIAEDEKERFPLAAPVVRSNFYVDNLLFGGNNLNSVVETCNQVIEMLKCGRFNLRQWCANEPGILAHIPPELREPSAALELDRSSSIKTLGLLWFPQQDQFRFKVPSLPPLKTVTKRIVLSEASQLFDPLGLVGPVVASAKIYIQQLWKRELAWDEPLPDELRDWWLAFRSSIDRLKELKITRWVLVSADSSYALHCFCDASEKGYGCCVYIISTDANGSSHSRLLIAKSRVAPVSSVSIPRLELCAAVLGSQLVDTVCQSTQFSGKTTFWTDSAVVLHWILSPPSSWRVFVSNRVAEINRLTKGHQWRHVPTDQNPADHISRGLSTDQLIQSDLWWNGPSFITDNINSWPPAIVRLSSSAQELHNIERKPLISLSTITLDDTLITSRSQLGPLLKTIAYCYRFINNCRVTDENRLFGFINPVEYDHALKSIVRLVQRKCFPDEIESLEAKDKHVVSNISSKSPLKNLNLILDSFGLLRLKGRLERLSAPIDTRFPMLLPAKHHLTNLIARSIHLQTLHSGPQLLLAPIRQRFWPLRGRDLARRTVHQCITCFRCRPRECKQFMGPLPSVRITPAKRRVGQSLGRSVYMYGGKSGPSRRRRRSLVVGMRKPTQAVLESRRSCTNYSLRQQHRVRGRESREMRVELKQQLQSAAVQSVLLQRGVQFQFIPPRAAHFGGLWEAAVKAFKHHFYRIMGQTIYVFDDFRTAVAQIESILNSRPLVPMSNHPEDLNALTPGHFLVGESQFSLPEPDHSSTPTNRLKHFQVMQKSVQDLWKRWSRDYIGLLHNRPSRWRSTPDKIETGTMVLLKRDNVPPLLWPLGRVDEVFPGKDGIVRVVNVRTAAGIFQRATTELCILPIEKDDVEAKDETDDNE